MNFLNIKYLPFFFLGLLSMTACNDDDVVIENEEELITTLRYALTPSNGGDTVTLEFQDLDGDGSNGASITGGTLQANTVYNGSVTLLNETESPAENITAEIEEEDEEHQLFFYSDVDGVEITYADADADGNPIGLSTVLTTGNAGSGTINIVLRHEPTKTSDMTSSEALLSNADGETDIEVAIDLTVE